MSERVINDPTVAGWELNPDTGYWMWAAGSGGYDDTEVRGMIADNSGRIDALEADSGGAVDAYTKSESDGRYVPKSGNTTIAGTLTATDFVAS